MDSDSESTNVTNIISTNVTRTVSVNSDNKKVRYNMVIFCTRFY